MADAQTTGRVSTSGIAQDIGTVLTNVEADVATVDASTIQVGGVGGTTTEPCHGFVHVKAVVAGTDSTAELAQADAIAEFAGALTGHNIALIPGEATSTVDV